jgi:uncharacterized protein UPF0158
MGRCSQIVGPWFFLWRAKPEKMHNFHYSKKLKERMNVKVLPVDMSELQFALGSSDGGLSLHKYWFDVETGAVIFLTEDLEEQDEVRDQIEENEDSRFVRIEPIDSREGFEMMESFVLSLPSTRMREKLEDALRGRKPFRRFKDTLTENLMIRERWFKFEEEVMRHRAIEWLAELEIEPGDAKGHLTNLDRFAVDG